MATINYYLDCRKKRADGTSPLKVVVNTCNGNFMMSIGIFVSPAQWNSKLRVVTKHPQRIFLNSHLSDMLLNAENALISEKKRLGHSLSMDEMKRIISPIFKDEYKQESPLVKVFNQYINDKLLKKRTHELYAVTLSKIESFSNNNVNSLQFEDITVGWLKKFDTWLMENCPSANARAIHLRNLRAVFNRAIDDELTSNYPFRKFKIVKEPTRKRALSVEQIRMLMNTPLQAYQRRYVDTFILMFYLMGINAVDLLTAKPSQVLDGRLEYKRAKTGTLYSIKIEPEAMEIINKYKGKKHLLKFCDTVKDYRDYLKRMNMCLNKIIPGCSSYYARHSCASIAAEIDIPMDTIARMLGHTDPARRITLVYIDFNQNKIDEANRKVIDYVTCYKNK